MMRGRAWFALYLMLGWSLLFLYSVHAALPYNPVTLPLERSVRIARFLPQGWAFFTRDPREERLTALRELRDGRLVPLTRAPHARAVNAFGLNRRSRSQSVEMGLLVAAAHEQKKDPWVACDGREVGCVAVLERGAHVLTVRNPAPRASLCGRIVLELQPPVPWAWSSSPPRMPLRLLPLNVEC
jgi:antimicrobial peptide system SdpA family protein